MYCNGPIVEAVARFSVFEDSKTFVDMPMKIGSVLHTETETERDRDRERERRTHTHRDLCVSLQTQGHASTRCIFTTRPDQTLREFKRLQRGLCTVADSFRRTRRREKKRDERRRENRTERERERERERHTHTHTHTHRQTHRQTHTSIMCTVADTDLTKKVVQDFLSEHFGAAGSDQEPWIPPDFPANATFAHRLTNETLRDWIQSVHDIWPQLGRQTNERLSL